MKEIIEYVSTIHVRFSGSGGDKKARVKLLTIIHERDIDMGGLSHRKLRTYFSTHRDFLMGIKSYYQLVYVFDYLIKYKLPDINYLREIYGSELLRYMVMESLRVNVPLDIKQRKLEPYILLSISKVGEYIKSSSGKLYLTERYVSNILRLHGYEVPDILRVWEALGICVVSRGLVIIITDVFKLLAQPPTFNLAYMLKWGRNERLGGVKLI